jgi:hypothetical protein
MLVGSQDRVERTAWQESVPAQDRAARDDYRAGGERAGILARPRTSRTNGGAGEHGPELVVVQGQRSTTTEYLPLHLGDPGKPDNYELSKVRIGADGNFSPRHQHTFEQLRWAFEHPVNCAPKLDLLPGHLGYFPESCYYGPVWLIVQFGDLSSLSWQELKRPPLPPGFKARTEDASRK